MKRDCDPKQKELIPDHYLILTHQNKQDKETCLPATGPNDARFEHIAQQLDAYGDVRLYICDKAGYRNCIRYMSKDANGQLRKHTDRRTEL